MDDEEFSLDLDGDAPAAPSVALVTPAVTSASESKEVAVLKAEEPVSAKSEPPLPKPAASSSASSSSIAPAVTKPVVAVTAEEEALLKRAARFGIQPVPVVLKKVEESKKNLRAERFGLPTPAAAALSENGSKKNSNKQQQQQQQGGNQNQQRQKQPAVAAAPLDPEMAAKLAKRAERFGVIAPALAKVEQQAQAQQEVRHWSHTACLVLISYSARVTMSHVDLFFF